MTNSELRDNHLYGNAVVGQSGGPTAAINATLAGVIRGVLKDRSYIGTLYGMRNGIDGLMRDDLLDLTGIFGGPDGETDLQRLQLTPAAALGSCRRKLPPIGDTATAGTDDTMEAIFDIFKKRNIRYFFYIGGNDSMDTVAKVSAYAERIGYKMRAVGVPKTIDNDLLGTDHTPGFGSAAKYIAVTVQEIIRDTAVYTVPAVTIVEIMGRDAGWLTASSALGRKITGFEPDFVYLPEKPFDFDAFYGDVETAFQKHPNVVIAVSEGLRCADGHYVGESTQQGAVDVFGHKYLAGTGKALELAVKARFGCKVRSIELNLPQRCAGHLLSLTDIAESVTVGSSAVDCALSGMTRRMMTIERTSDKPYGCQIGHRDVFEIANKTRYVPDEFINPANNHVTDACVDYLLPLIAGEVYPEYKDGLPVHFILK